MFPQALQVRTPADSPITGSGCWNGDGAGAGAYTGVADAGAGGAAGAIWSARDPQIPQNFSEGESGLPHELQRDGESG
jgi:hypothetical protein